jgi:hypothetical protein
VHGKKDKPIPYEEVEYMNAALQLVRQILQWRLEQLATAANKYHAKFKQRVTAASTAELFTLLRSAHAAIENSGQIAKDLVAVVCEDFAATKPKDGKTGGGLPDQAAELPTNFLPAMIAVAKEFDLTVTGKCDTHLRKLKLEEGVRTNDVRSF